MDSELFSHKLSTRGQSLKRILLHPFDWLRARIRRGRKARKWEQGWSRSDFSAPWLNRGISREIVAAVQEGLFVRPASVLDLGCGQGDVVAWFVEQGFDAFGVDIAPSAIARARSRFPPVPGKCEFHVVDVCEQSADDRQYRILIDRGCFHQIPAPDRPSYVRNLLRVSAPDARMLLFVKAFREGQPVGDSAERRRVTDEVVKAFGKDFAIIRDAVTFLDPFEGKQPDRQLPGMVYWLERKAPTQVH